LNSSIDNASVSGNTIVQWIRYRVRGLIRFWLRGQTLPKQRYAARPARLGD